MTISILRGIVVACVVGIVVGVAFGELVAGLSSVGAQQNG